MGKIRDTQRDVGERVFDLSEGSLGVLNAIPQLLHRRGGFVSRFFGSAQPSHLVRALIEFVPELLDLRRHGSPFVAQFLEIIPRDVVSASSESGADLVEVFAELLQIVHRSFLKKAVGI